MKLELKHIAPYLPYGLKFKTADGWCTLLTINYDDSIINESYEESYELNEIKPILRPLSDLMKEIEVNGKTTLYIDHISNSNADEKQTIKLIENNNSLEVLEYWKILKLYEWHFDLHNLIEQGLAVDVNSI